MMTSSNGNIFSLLAICAGNSPATAELPTQRPVMRSFDVFFDLRLNKRLRKSRGWWSETPSIPLWRHCNECRKCMHKRDLLLCSSYVSRHYKLLTVHQFGTLLDANYKYLFDININRLLRNNQANWEEVYAITVTSLERHGVSNHLSDCVDSPHKGANEVKMFPCHGVILMKHMIL